MFHGVNGRFHFPRWFLLNIIEKIWRKVLWQEHSLGAMCEFAFLCLNPPNCCMVTNWQFTQTFPKKWEKRRKKNDEKKKKRKRKGEERRIDRKKKRKGKEKRREKRSIEESLGWSIKFRFSFFFSETFSIDTMQHFWLFFFSIITEPLAQWVVCSPMVLETGIQSQVESYQRLKKMVLDATLLNTQDQGWRGATQGME